jgi:predicted signal transduction protein with EAL and GGDEF domain
VHAYGKRRPLLATSAEARRWEQRYVFGAAAHVLLMGFWCLAAFAKTSDPFVQISSLSLTALAAANLPTSRLGAGLPHDTELTRHWLDELQEMGVRISLDEFGTGYSSLGYLFPAQQGEDRPLLSAGRRHQR